VRRLATLLPARHLAAARETTRIPRVAGLTSGRTAVVITLPFRARHHTTSDVTVIDGGQVPMPREVSLAHQGLLWLDAPHSKSLRKM
jgi:magnesium chelatase family protein